MVVRENKRGKILQILDPTRQGACEVITAEVESLQGCCTCDQLRRYIPRKEVVRQIEAGELRETRQRRAQGALEALVREVNSYNSLMGAALCSIARNALPPARIQSLSLSNRSPVPRNIKWISGDRFLHEEQDLRILQQISRVVY